MYYNPKVINGDDEAILCCADYIDIPEGAAINKANIYFAIKEKLTDLVEDYINESEQLGQDGIKNTTTLIFDFLKVEPTAYNIETVVDLIMNSPQMVSFFDSKVVELKILSESFTVQTENRALKQKANFIASKKSKLKEIGLIAYLEVLSQINY